MSSTSSHESKLLLNVLQICNTIVSNQLNSESTNNISNMLYGDLIPIGMPPDNILGQGDVFVDKNPAPVPTREDPFIRQDPYIPIPPSSSSKNVSVKVVEPEYRGRDLSRRTSYRHHRSRHRDRSRSPSYYRRKNSRYQGRDRSRRRSRSRSPPRYQQRRRLNKTPPFRTVPCRYYPNCTYGKRCQFRHPNGDYPDTIYCKKCSNYHQRNKHLQSQS